MKDVCADLDSHHLKWVRAIDIARKLTLRSKPNDDELRLWLKSGKGRKRVVHEAERLGATFLISDIRFGPCLALFSEETEISTDDRCGSIIIATSAEGRRQASRFD